MIYLIILLGLFLRLVSLNQSLWLDEATTALVSKMSTVDIFTKFLPGDFHPPLYYLIIKYWVNFFGNSEVSLRIPSVIFGVFTIYLIYAISKKMFNQKVALLASFFLATSGLAIYYSQEARMYGLATFLVAAAVYLFLEKKWVWLSVALLLIGMTDYVALMVLPVFWIFAKKDIKKLFLSHFPLLLGFLIWSKTFFTQLTMGGSLVGTRWWNILGLPTFKNIILIPVKFVLGRISFDNNFVYGLVVLISLSLTMYVLYFSQKASKFLWFWLVLPILLGILLSFKIPTLTYFRFVFCLPAMYILLAYGVFNLKKFSNFAMVALIFINLASTGYYLLNNKFHREDWKSLVSYVENQKDERSITIFVANSNMEAYRYYSPNAKISGPDGVVGGYNQIWLMRYVQDIFDPSDSVRVKIENLGYKKVGEFSFNGVNVWEYVGSEKVYAYNLIY